VSGGPDAQVAGARRRLLALDVDGTLLTTAQTMSSRTRDALVDAEAAGWHIALITGRPLAHAMPVVEELGLGEFVVAANGATVAEISSGAVLYQASLPGELVVEAIRRSRLAVPALGLAVSTPGRFVQEPGFDILAPLSKADGDVVDDACPRADEVVHSVVLFVDGMDALALRDAVAAVVPDGVAVSPSGLPGSVELTAPGVHKGSGVIHLSARLGVQQDDVVAFGDGLNDHEMLAWAGLGVAMGNASAETKAMADEVTTSNDEDGVALVVERLVGRTTVNGGIPA